MSATLKHVGTAVHTGSSVFMKYKDQLKDPRWQRKRLEILNRDKWTCQICLDTTETLHVHHKSYDGVFIKLAWQYDNHVYTTLCDTCHIEIERHIKEHGSDEEFDLFKIFEGEKYLYAVIYSKGAIILKTYTGEMIMSFSERLTKKLIHFAINNWLKNG